jgi:catechol 2,3-dioxygenase-like lactoylglutathione lyase family enzyme
VHIDRIDHLVLTVDDIDRTIAFYVGVLGMTETTFRSDRKARTFGTSKINLHQRGREYEPRALTPTPGSADVCLIVEEPIDVVVTELTATGSALRTARSSAPAPRVPSSASTSATPTPT